MNSESLIFKKNQHIMVGDREFPQAAHREERVELESKVANRFNVACEC